MFLGEDVSFSAVKKLFAGHCKSHLGFDPFGEPRWLGQPVGNVGKAVQLGPAADFALGAAGQCC